MLMYNNKGQTGAVEGIIIIVCVLVIGFLIWLLFKKPSESTFYQADSKPRVTDIAPHPSFGGCVSVKVEEFMETKHAKNISFSNSIKP